MTLKEAPIKTTFLIKEIIANDKITTFLRTLGCMDDEEITIISKISNNWVINVKDTRYAIDKNIAECIVLCD
ncbi:FeoA family protein [Candidatus Epulonipiscium viviparus]|uniref:FeoA family protein n=1 Tax=Candidatus Epulonipiscium viviparus TaxID=420336 RepID=UPI00016C09D9|nr:ferrous iron transport protein A [Candidatus Epulopiscium viviparus]